MSQYGQVYYTSLVNVQCVDFKWLLYDAALSTVNTKLDENSLMLATIKFMVLYQN